MSGFAEPNYTQTPNELFDTHMATMGEAELRVTLAVVRKTLGFHKAKDAISYSQIMEMTGLSRTSTQDGINKAIEHGFIEIAENGKRGINVFRLVVLPDQSTKATSSGSVALPMTGSVTLLTKETEKENNKIKVKKSAPKPSPSVIFRKEWEANNAMGMALLKEFACDFIPVENQTVSSLTPYLEVAKELTTAGATIESIPLLGKYIAQRAKSEEWTKYGVRTYAKYYTEFLKQHKPKVIYDNPAMDLNIPQVITPILISEQRES